MGNLGKIIVVTVFEKVPKIQSPNLVTLTKGLRVMYIEEALVVMCPNAPGAHGHVLMIA